jgi:hypothetical protein
MPSTTKMIGVLRQPAITALRQCITQHGLTIELDETNDESLIAAMETVRQSHGFDIDLYTWQSQKDDPRYFDLQPSMYSAAIKALEDTIAASGSTYFFNECDSKDVVRALLYWGEHATLDPFLYVQRNSVKRTYTPEDTNAAIQAETDADKQTQAKTALKNLSEALEKAGQHNLFAQIDQQLGSATASRLAEAVTTLLGSDFAKHPIHVKSDFRQPTPGYENASLPMSDATPLTDAELNEALQLHRLTWGKPNQLADSFRAGARWAWSKAHPLKTKVQHQPQIGRNQDLQRTHCTCGLPLPDKDETINAWGNWRCSCGIGFCQDCGSPLNADGDCAAYRALERGDLE